MATEEISLTKDELTELGAKLDGCDLTEKDKSVLVAAFAVAAQAISNEADVTGFALRAASGFDATALRGDLRGGLSSGFQNSLSQGQLGNFNNKAVIISVGF